MATLTTMAALLAAACSTVTPGDGQSVEKGHPFRAERLRTVMRSFDQTVKNNVPEDTDLYDRWDGVFPKIADEAAALGESARTLAGHPPKGLEIPERGRFSMMAHQLVTAAENLQDAAARSDADAVKLARADVATTCRTCHERYLPQKPAVTDALR